jgi:membrane protease YdiL (CAAX protease family)
VSSRPDYPYYDGAPVAISPGGWALVVASCALAFLVLTLWPFPNFPLNFVSATLFTIIPLIALMAVTGWRRPAMFRSFGVKEIAIAIGFGLLTIICSFVAGYILSRFIPLASNNVATSVANMSFLETLFFLAPTLIQLVGEEVVTILPLLAVLWLCVSRFGMARHTAIIVAVAVSTVWFAALHLPTYDWNILQCLFTIGTARIVLTLCYLLTRNLWVSSLAHIINDWSLFFMSFLLGHGPIGVGG